MIKLEPDSKDEIEVESGNATPEIKDAGDKDLETQDGKISTPNDEVRESPVQETIDPSDKSRMNEVSNSSAFMRLIQDNESSGESKVNNLLGKPAQQASVPKDQSKK